VKKIEIPLGAARRLTVASPSDPDGIERVLEPSDHPAVRSYKVCLDRG
jgi:hypothetical protein